MNTITNTYSLVSAPYYDSKTKCYKKIIKINKMPTITSSLATIVKQIQYPKLSPFKSNSAFSACSNCCNSDDNQCCIYAITNISNHNELMCINDLPSLFTFLINNGYTIDTSITKMMQSSNVKLNNDLICFITGK